MDIKQLTKKYQDNQVFESIELHLLPGVAHGLLGANGAGKSTLIKIIMDLVFADSGQIVKPESMSLLPENPYLPDNLTAYQIVSHACRSQKASNQPDELLLEVQLKKEAWHKPIRTYSKGMKQRTAIAYALAGTPQWLILDEPMSGLDAMGRKQMLDIFQKRKDNGMTILMCSHSVTDLVRLCQQVHIMAAGKLCETFDIQEHSMHEAETLEQKLETWSSDYALD